MSIGEYQPESGAEATSSKEASSEALGQTDDEQVGMPERDHPGVVAIASTSRTEPHRGDRSKRGLLRLISASLLAVAVLALVAVFVRGLLPSLKPATPASASSSKISSSSSVERVQGNADINNFTADSAPKQQVVNGWHQIGLQEIEIDRLDDTVNASLATGGEIQALRSDVARSNTLLEGATKALLVLIGLSALQVVLRIVRIGRP